MRIAIITVYQPFTNWGSFLQAYSLAAYLRERGHEVKFVYTSNHFHSAVKKVIRVRPIRSYILRVKQVYWAIRDLNLLSFVNQELLSLSKFDLCIVGSDEIWNITNKFFCRPLFFGGKCENVPTIAYAVSAGHATIDDFLKYSHVTRSINTFKAVFARDVHTAHILQYQFKIDTHRVVDPTLLVDIKNITRPITLPKHKYLLVYSYGFDNHITDVVVNFARNRNLRIISPFFWHHWADQVIECSALQFSTLVAGAEYVFTTTFHGAIIALINHSKCAILPLREKVADLCMLLGVSNRLISENCNLRDFESTISIPFPVLQFEDTLQKLRADSRAMLDNEINKLNL